MKMTLNTLNDKDPWVLGEDIPDCDLFFNQIWASCFTNEFAEPAGRAYAKVMTVFRDGYHLWFYFGEKDSNEVAETILKKFLETPDFTTELNKQIVVEADKLRKCAEALPEERLEALSDEALADFHENHDKVHTEYYRFCWVPVAVDMFHNNFTNAMKNYLEQKGSGEKLNEHFTILTQPTQKSLIQQEQEDFLEIAVMIQADSEQRQLFKELFKLFEDQEAGPYGLQTHTPEYEELLEKKMDTIRQKISTTILKAVEKHYQKYFYVKYMYVGKEGVHSFNHYLKELTKFIGRNSDAKELLNEKHSEMAKNMQLRDELFKELDVDDEHKTLFDAFGDFMVTKIYRRYAQIYALYRMKPVLAEIARRLGISEEAAHFLLPSEVRPALIEKKYSKEELEQRTKFCVHYTEKDNEEVFIGAEAEKLAKLTEREIDQDVSELSGQTGCIGAATGVVKKIFRPSDMSKMNEGDILVSIATDPDIVPAMKKAAAIVTDQGGVTSHAAIVSRELGIPCVIGTKIASQVLNDGDVVEVDAHKGIVKILEKG